MDRHLCRQTDPAPGERGASERLRGTWISDAHRGTRGCRAATRAEFLEQHACDRLWLAGDVTDGWRLKSRRYGAQAHTNVIRRVLTKARRGCHGCRLPGAAFCRDASIGAPAPCRHLPPAWSASRNDEGSNGWWCGAPAWMRERSVPMRPSIRGLRARSSCSSAGSPPRTTSRHCLGSRFPEPGARSATGRCAPAGSGLAGCRLARIPPRPRAEKTRAPERKKPAGESRRAGFRRRLRAPVRSPSGDTRGCGPRSPAAP